MALTGHVVPICLFVMAATATRERRALVFPTGTVLQLSLGVQMPVTVPNRTFTISYGFQMVFNLPTNATQWRTPPELVGKRDTYLPLEGFLEDHGFKGRECLLRVICELSRSPFLPHDMNLFEEILLGLLTPSEVLRPGAGSWHYLTAENVGKRGGDCPSAYPQCPESPLDLITNTLSPVPF